MAISSSSKHLFSSYVSKGTDIVIIICLSSIRDKDRNIVITTVDHCMYWINYVIRGTYHVKVDGNIQRYIKSSISRGHFSLEIDYYSCFDRHQTMLWILLDYEQSTEITNVLSSSIFKLHCAWYMIFKISCSM